MNNRSGGPRSFNTVKHSNREDRLRRRRQGRMVLLSMCAVVLLLVLTGLIFLVCEIAAVIANRPPADPNKDQPGNTTVTGIQYLAETKRYEDIYTGDLIVVNNSHAYTFPTVRLENLDAETKKLYTISEYRQQVNGVTPYSLNVSSTLLLQPAAAQALNQMLTQYYTVFGDNEIYVSTAYRTEKEQEDVKKANPSTQDPGYSEHHTGFDIRLRVRTSSGGYEDLNEQGYSWIYENCYKYGYIQRYPSNKSGLTGISYNYTECFRYVGVAHAAYILQNKICLEEYVELLKNNHTSTTGTDGKHLSIDTNADGKTDYEVYYVPANAGANALTTIPVPANYGYTVSGDNIGGFIVTINLNAPKTA